MRVKLKLDWDVPTRIGGGGHFVGRGSQLDFLKNELTRKNSGSILIGGSRGSGKTSIVIKALSDLKNSTGRGSSIIPVVLNAPNLLMQEQPDKSSRKIF